ncbi:MAG: hypothetical protein GC189_09555 [Alphaproteobacteria bacterium]|nr:hypothetical protein [Alphaproteobacteria bacterium]
MKKLIALAILAALAACQTNPWTSDNPPLPPDGPILYSCADGTQLQVTYEGDQALVSIVGGVSMALPATGTNYYSNGRYGLRGAGAAAQWEVGRRAPTSCQGG